VVYGRKPGLTDAQYDMVQFNESSETLHADPAQSSTPVLPAPGSSVHAELPQSSAPTVPGPSSIVHVELPQTSTPIVSESSSHVIIEAPAEPESSASFHPEPEAAGVFGEKAGPVVALTTAATEASASSDHPMST
jgi:hypothetical protein